jgi:drug/metabolite transporter (DMT)-like permease
MAIEQRRPMPARKPMTLIGRTGDTSGMASNDLMASNGSAAPADRSALVDWLVFLALGLMWGSSYLFIKIGVETLEPFTLIAARLGIGLIVLATVVAFAREPLPREPRTYFHLIVLSVFSVALPFFLITSAEQSTDSSLAAIINASVPLFTIAIAAVALHDEPITVSRLAGLVVGFVGVFILVSRGLDVSGSGSGGDSSLYGEIALVGSSISYAVGAVYARRNVRGLRPMIPALFQVGFAFVITAVLAVVLEHPFATVVRPDAVFAVVWLGILGSGFAYLAFFRLLARWGATRATLVAYVLPIVGIVLGVLVLNEQVDARILVGTVLIIGGVALVNSRYGQRPLFRLARQPGGPT